MVFDYRAIVIPAALLSRNPADFRRFVYSYSQRFKLATDTFKGPDETQEPGFRPEPSLRSGSRLHTGPMFDASSSRPIFCEGAPSLRSGSRLHTGPMFDASSSRP
ncbi:MAG: hypothetical protein WB930_09460, partial [Syntrophobacteraceae bacterium]